MTSKNSFWDSMKLNLNRRNSVTFVTYLVLAAILPIFSWVTLSATKSQALEYNDKTDPVLFITQLRKMFVACNYFDALPMVLIIGIAIFAGIQGFYYLHSKVKMDMYLSQPVDTKRRFAVIYLNGFFIFASAYFVSQVFSILIALPYKIVDGRMIVIMLTNYVYACLFYLMVYSIAILATILTGNLITAILGTGVFLLYGMCWQFCIESLRSVCYLTYVSSSGGLLRNGDTAVNGLYNITIMRPLIQYTSLGELINTMILATREAASAGIFNEFLKNFAKNSVELLLVDALLVIGCLFFYSKRKSESAGISMTFSWMKPVIELVIVIPAGLLGGLLIGEFGGESIVFYVVGIIMAVVIVHIVIQLIYEGNMLAGIGKKALPLLGACLVATILVYTYYATGISGYDSYVPDKAQLESAAYYCHAEAIEGAFYDFDKNNVSYYEDYLFGKMEYKDYENIVEIAKRSAEVNDRKVIKTNELVNFLVCYRLKNGKEVSRKLYLDPENLRTEMNKLLSSDAYKESIFQVLDKNWDTTKEKINVHITTKEDERYISKNQFMELKECYRKDCELYDYDFATKHFPVARIEINIGYCTVNNPIYPEYTNTIAYLENAGIEIKSAYDVDEIAKLDIEYYSYDGGETKKVESYTDAAQVKEILDCMEYRCGDAGWYDYYKAIGGEVASEGYINYTITKKNAEIEDCYLKQDAKLPEYVKKALEGYY